MVFSPFADWKVQVLIIGIVEEEVSSVCVAGELLGGRVIGQQDKHNVASYTKTSQAPS